MSLDIGADGPNTSPGIGPVDLVQVWKAAFVKVNFARLDFEPRTFSYPGRCTTHKLLAIIFFFMNKVDLRSVRN